MATNCTAWLLGGRVLTLHFSVLYVQGVCKRFKIGVQSCFGVRVDRHKACPYDGGRGVAVNSCQRWREWFADRLLGGTGQAQGLSNTVVTADGFAARRGWATGGTDSAPATRRQRGMVYGGRCGGNPPAQGRAEGPTAQNCSGQ